MKTIQVRISPQKDLFLVHTVKLSSASMRLEKGLKSSGTHSESCQWAFLSAFHCSQVTSFMNGLLLLET